MYIASVEDDKGQSALIREILTSAGYACESFQSGGQFLRTLREHAFDLVVLDWQLPDMSGYDILTWVRQNFGRHPPILFLTSRSLERDIVMGLDAGADDYMIKPVRRSEFIARVAALLRRTSIVKRSGEVSFAVGDYVIDANARTISLRQMPIAISPREFDLALFLFCNVGRLVSRDVIEKSIWGRTTESRSRTVDTYLSRLRLKLCLSPENGVRLVSVYSYGYRFEATVKAPDDATQGR